MINVALLRDFSKIYEFDYIWKDIFDNYKITGYIPDEEYMYYLVDCLHEDMLTKRVNYKAYMKLGITARMMIELRNSMILGVEEEYKFYESHDKLKTAEEVKQFRINFLREHFIPDYDESDGYWQLYYLCMLSFKPSRFEGLLLDFEPCYEDAQYYTATDPDDYRMQKVESNQIPHKIYEKDGKYHIQIEWDKVYQDVLDRPNPTYEVQYSKK